MTNDTSDDDEYKVGYGKPPLATRFKPGVCPNKKGRGKGTKNFETEIKEELRAKITVHEDGRRKKITKRRAIAKQIVNKSAMGDLKAIPVLLNETRDKNGNGNALPVIFDTPDDEAVMTNLIARIRDQIQSSPQLDAKSSDLPETPSDNGGTP